MAISRALCNSAKTQLLSGFHSSSSTYKIALFTSTATLDATTTAYSSTNEVIGTGYTAGGMLMTGWSSSLNNGVGCLTFDNVTWTNASITARGALIYNTSGSSALAVLDFGSDFASSSGSFALTFPTNISGSALIEIA